MRGGRAYGLAFTLPDDLRQVYLGFGNDLAVSNGDPSWQLPVPARFVSIARESCVPSRPTRTIDIGRNRNRRSRFCARSQRSDRIMVKRLSDMPEVEANHLRRIECPTYDDTPLLAGKPLAERRVADHLDRRPAQARRPAVPPGRRQLPRHPGRDAGQRSGDEPHLGQFRPHRLSAGSQRRLPDRSPARAGGRRPSSARWRRSITPSWELFRRPRPSRMPSISPAC